MDFKLIMENWKRFSSLISEQASNVASLQKWFWDRGFAHNPKNKSEEDWVDGVVGPEYRQTVRNFQTKAKELKIYSRSVDAKVGSGTLTAIKNYDNAVSSSASGPAVKPEPSAKVAPSIQSVANKDKAIGQAIAKLSKTDIDNSSLFYDGVYLYWMVSGSPIQKWRAYSGQYENIVNKQWKARAIINTIKKLQNEEGRPEQEVISDLRSFVDYVPDTIASAGQDNVWLRRQHAEKLYNLFNIAQSDKSQDSQRKLKGYFDFLFDYYDIDTYIQSSDEKRAVSKIKNTGPIPEGEYAILHKMQSLPSHRKAGASFYDIMYLTMTNFVGDDDALPYQKITDEEFEKVLGSKLSSAGEGAISKKIKDAVDWGNFRVRITKLNPKASKLMRARGAGYQKRNGFLIHGGSIRGSSGCIDLGDRMDSFAKFWTVAGVGKAVSGGGRPGSLHRARITIPLVVKYSDEARENLVTKNSVAKRFANIIFNQSGTSA